MTKPYHQIRVDNIVWAIKELRRNYVVVRDDTFTALEYAPKDEKLASHITKFDGAVSPQLLDEKLTTHYGEIVDSFHWHPLAHIDENEMLNDWAVVSVWTYALGEQVG